MCFVVKRAFSICFSIRSAFLSSHSQIRTTFHPALRKARFTTRSRVLLPSILRRHHAARFAGHVACFGHPCQKQPSTKIAVRDLRKTKSGRTVSREPRDERREPETASPSPRWGEGRGEVRFLSTLNQRLSTVARINKCQRQPEIPFARNSRANASSVSLFPRPRIRDMTSERFRFEKTSAILQPFLPRHSVATAGAFSLQPRPLRLGENVRHFFSTTDGHR